MFNLRSTMLVAGAVFASFSGFVVAETTDQMEEEVIDGGVKGGLHLGNYGPGSPRWQAAPAARRRSAC